MYSSRRHRVLASVIVVAAAVVVYRAAISAYFFDDDSQWLVGAWAFQPMHLLDFAHLNHFYRPVIDLYFATATPLFGGSPTLFHLANIGFHAANGLLLLALARAMSGSTAYAFLTALFFVVQPPIPMRLRGSLRSPKPSARSSGASPCFGSCGSVEAADPDGTSSRSRHFSWRC